jgi:proteasome lid subunit RPN8/RPN11
MRSCTAVNSSRLEISASLWQALMHDLRQRGGAERESGAFLLGSHSGGVRQVTHWVPYDDLDSGALLQGYVRLGTDAFTRLWAKCSQLRLEVVADLHTHPGGPRQSDSDRAHPMICKLGHLALIVPNYAQGVVRPHVVSLNIYQGNKQWISHFGRDAEALIRLT